jgi:hypothetical protein
VDDSEVLVVVLFLAVLHAAIIKAEIANSSIFDFIFLSF